MIVPISEVSYVELYRGFGPAQQHHVVASFVDVLRKILAPKFITFERIAASKDPADLEMSTSA